MKQKQVIRLNESQLRRIVSESVKRILKEDEQDIDDDTYFGGGLPEPKPQVYKYTCEKEITAIYNKMKPYIDKLEEIFNDSETDDRTVYDNVMEALNVLDTLPLIGKQFYTVEYDEY